MHLMRTISPFLRCRHETCCISNVGEEVTRTTYSREHQREYRRKVRLCLDVFETMLAQTRFEADRPLTGMEIECNLVDADYQPAMSNRYVLDAIADPAYQTELGAYNIEFNVPPRPLPGRTCLELEDEVRASLNDAETKASCSGAHIVMIGILPTLMPEHLTDGWMSASARYAALNESIFKARGEDIPINIAGPEPLSCHAGSIAPESACTSVQLYLQLAPADFPANWNAAQVLAGPQLALGANSPYFFGHQLWSETRIELFTQSTDARPEELKSRGVRPRVWFGERWITSVLDLFQENIRYFPTLLPEVSDEDPSQSFRLDASHTCPNCGCITARCTGGTGRCTTWSTGARICGWRTGCYPPGRRSLTCWRIMPSTTAHYAVCPRPTPIVDADEFRCGTSEFPGSRQVRHGRPVGLAGLGRGDDAGVGVGHVVANGTRGTAAVGCRRGGTRPVPGCHRRSRPDRPQRRALAGRHRGGPTRRRADPARGTG